MLSLNLEFPDILALNNTIGYNSWNFLHGIEMWTWKQATDSPSLNEISFVKKLSQLFIQVKFVVN